LKESVIFYIDVLEDFKKRINLYLLSKPLLKYWQLKFTHPKLKFLRELMMKENKKERQLFVVATTTQSCETIRGAKYNCGYVRLTKRIR